MSIPLLKIAVRCRTMAGAGEKEATVVTQKAREKVEGFIVTTGTSLHSDFDESERHEVEQEPASPQPGSSCRVRHPIGSEGFRVKFRRLCFLVLASV